jgi:N6-L-threonylcarbamoyladenine synthase
VSGGHTELLLMTGHGRYRLLGKTIDDAAGEAFDKAARILGLGYPGGPAIQAAAQSGDASRFNFPRAWLKGTLDFSFSGLKTALLRKVEEYGVAMVRPAPWQRSADPGIATPQTSQARDTGVLQTSPKVAALAESATGVSSFRSEPLREEDLKVPPVRARVSGGTLSVPPEPESQPPAADRGPLPVADLAASFQAAIVDILVEKTASAASEAGAAEVLLAGGVAANSLLRQSLANRLSVPFRYPPLDLCTDNAAMIAAAAYYRFTDYRQHDLTLDIEPNHRFY